MGIIHCLCWHQKLFQGGQYRRARVPGAHTCAVQDPEAAVSLVDSAQEVFKLREQGLAAKHRQAELQALLDEARSANAALTGSLNAERLEKGR